ncbi:helix-turn-helix domain-containing protein [Vibrio sp. V15_P4S5T153]|uniref:helix-turn-helix domain-containing protein n=1 Tax=Vibrio sp. V15_P4S5T153 TaxID=1938669 RepID=UPI000B8F376B|nr:helix-turn-helix domain-containing protein [Vibrio sp. V15_P4S5T153]OXX64444.1 hypothetical protein B9J89_00620 [Vibrio sp. V15_P4S5T153]
MKKAIRKVTYKLKPSVSQEESLINLFVHHHQLYNWALRDRIETSWFNIASSHVYITVNNK